MDKITRCSCGHKSCEKYQVDKKGDYYQGTGHAIHIAKQIAALDEIMEFITNLTIGGCPPHVQKAANTLLDRISEQRVSK